MKLYKVTRPNERGWGEYYGFVVRAENEAQARFVAAEAILPEILCRHSSIRRQERRMWLERSTVQEVRLRGEPGVILTSFIEG